MEYFRQHLTPLVIKSGTYENGDLVLLGSFPYRIDLLAVKDKLQLDFLDFDALSDTPKTAIKYYLPDIPVILLIEHTGEFALCSYQYQNLVGLKDLMLEVLRQIY